MPVVELSLHLPRHAVSPRQVARAAEIWRLCQDAAVLACIDAGWPPDRLIAIGSAFMVYAMTVRHIREVGYGTPLSARTWVRDFRRGVLTKREVQISDAAGPVARATQEWVHVNLEGRPARASAALMASFPPHDSGDPPVELPPYEPHDGARTHRTTFTVWHTWMDPLGHANHPAYVDWSDEGTSRALHAAGIDPHRLVPVAEHVEWKRGVFAPSRVAVETRVCGRAADGVVALCHEVREAEGGGELYATATTLRRLAGAEDGELLAALG